jgi:ATP-dependent 26S proteasome regulatory subunit
MAAADAEALAVQLQRSCQVTNIAHGCSGYDDVLQALREVVIWPSKYAKEAAALGLKWPKGCLLHGPPGVGKSTFLRVCFVLKRCNGCMHQHKIFTCTLAIGSGVLSNNN